MTALLPSVTEPLSRLQRPLTLAALLQPGTAPFQQATAPRPVTVLLSSSQWWCPGLKHPESRRRKLKRLPVATIMTPGCWLMIISELRVFASSIPMHFLQNNSNFETFGLRHSTPPPPFESFSVYLCRIFVGACARIIMSKYKSKLIGFILVLVQKEKK